MPTLARSGEVRGLTWDELDLNAPDGPLWTIPAGRMKAGNEHRVPLPEAAEELLKSIPEHEDGPYVFFSIKGGKPSDMSLSSVRGRMQESEVNAGNQGWLDPRSKRPAAPHGLRSSFRGWIVEQEYARDISEICLAYNVGSDVERAYHRSDMLERRRQVLRDWEQFLTGKMLPEA